MDWDDQDGPPDLVGTGTELAPEEKPVKVPITIVTGPYLGIIFSWRARSLTGNVCRISGCWQDNSPELHPYC